MASRSSTDATSTVAPAISTAVRPLTEPAVKGRPVGPGQHVEWSQARFEGEDLHSREGAAVGHERHWFVEAA